MKLCARCGLEKPTDAYGKNAGRPDGLQTYCRSCWKSYQDSRAEKRREYNAAYYADTAQEQRDRANAWYTQNRERAKERSLARYHANREALNEANKARQRRYKDETFAAYGGYVCRCCGETIRDFLTIDHIQGCGRDTRKIHGLGGNFYRWLKRNGYPEGFQVLCFNCNLGRSLHGGRCPHVSD
jgi:rubrerythrin